MAIKYIIFNFTIFILLSKCNNSNFEVQSKYNHNHTSTIFLLKGNKKIDSLRVNSYYGKDSLINLKKDNWVYLYNERCGTGCSTRRQILFSIKNNKLKECLNIEAFYRESVIGDQTFKKNFIRETFIEKEKEKILIKRNYYKNDNLFLSNKIKLEEDKNESIYFNKYFDYNSKKYKGLKIDSTEYIYYKNNWFKYNSKNLIIFLEQ